MSKHLDLCSGIGGFALAAGWAGYRTIGFCEIDPYCQKVLRKHWPEVPIHADLRTLTADAVRGWACETDALANDPGFADREQPDNGVTFASERDAWLESRRSGNGRAHRRAEPCVGLVTAGYPCQPFSQAGKRLGAEDDRHLWPTIAALVAELRPDQCLFENVAGHITLGLDRVLADLEEIGYACRPVVVPACAVNAPHRRDRVWIVADANGAGRREQRRAIAGAPKHAPAERGGGREALSTVGHAHDGLPRWLARPVTFGSDWEHGVSRVTAHEDQRVNKLKALGNSIVPSVAYEILVAMQAAA